MSAYLRTAKTALRSIAARLVHQFGLTDPKTRSKGLFTIVTFHRVLPDSERAEYPFPGLAVSPEHLDAIITFLVQHFDCGTLEQQSDRYSRCQATDKPLLAVTFDDAQYDNYRHARPVLAKHGVLASFFAPVAAIERKELLWHDQLGFALQGLLRKPEGGRQELASILSGAGLAFSGETNPIHRVVQDAKRLTLSERLGLVSQLTEASGQESTPEFARMMTYDELTTLANDGHEIGSHSMTHCLMTECNDEMLQYELSESRHRLETALGRPVGSFCYPNGNCDTRTARAAEAAGYRRAVTTRWGHNHSRTDVFQLRRFDMESAYLTDSTGTITPALVAYRISGFNRKP